MQVQQGNRVAVNLAPFIGSMARSRQSVVCRVLEIQPDHVKVCTEEPCRYVALWIQPHWIESVLGTPSSLGGGTARRGSLSIR